MAGRYGRRYIKDEDFEEEDIWNIMEEKENSSKKPMKKSDSSSTNSRHFSTNYIANPRMIPKSSSSSSTNEIAPSKQFSAPLDIPDWSKIYGNTSKKKKIKKINSSSSSSTSWVNVNHDGYYVNNANDDEGFNDYDNDFDGYGDDDDDDDDGMVPPHEYLARKLARSQISSFSVYEGIGRTLKGRDLSKLRNAILTKTGFLE